MFLLDIPTLLLCECMYVIMLSLSLSPSSSLSLFLSLSFSLSLPPSLPPSLPLSPQSYTFWLYIPEGTGVTSGASVPTSRFSGDPQGSPLHSLPAASGSLVLPSLKPNPYLVCKLFCTKPSPQGRHPVGHH